MADQEKRPELDKYLAPKLRSVRVTTGEAREALDELIAAAKKQGNRTAELIGIVLQKIIQSEETISRDIEFVRSRLDVIEKELTRRPRR
jgi:hypothetical protein